MIACTVPASNPQESRHGPVGTGSLEAWQKEQRDPNDADDDAKGAGMISIIGSPFLQFRPPMHPMTLHGGNISLSPAPRRTFRLVFKTVRAHDADFAGFGGPRTSEIFPCRGDLLLERKKNGRCEAGIRTASAPCCRLIPPN